MEPLMPVKNAIIFKNLYDIDMHLCIEIRPIYEPGQYLVILHWLMNLAFNECSININKYIYK